METKSKFGFSITEHKTLGNVTVVAHASNNISRKLIEICKMLFEMEMYYAITTVKDDITTIQFSTYNKENVEFLRVSLFKTFRHRSVLNNINYN